jgi:hypothetical protein
MYMRLKDLFVAEGLPRGLRSSGGNGAIPGKMPISSSCSGLPAVPISSDRGGDWYVMVDVISSKANPDAADAAVNAIVEYISAQSGADDCVGALRLVGNVPAPVPTEEGRLVTRLLVSCTYGNKHDLSLRCVLCSGEC